jgi:hypothetical protein
MRIESLRKYNGRNANGYFNDLPPHSRLAAWRWLAKFEARWGRNLPRWRRAILIGQAKRLALMSAEERSTWGRSMLGKRGGKAVQRKYAAESQNPTAAATRARAYRVQRRKKSAAEGAERRKIQAALSSYRWSR